MKTHEISVEIAAPVSAVWTLLTDLPGYAAWNRAIPAASGRIVPGEKLKLRLDFGDRQQPFDPRVVDVREGRLLLLAKTVFHPRLLRATHAFILEPLAEDRIRLIQRWELSGLLSSLLWPQFSAGLPGFARMSEDLKHLVERNCAPDAARHPGGPAVSLVAPVPDVRDPASASGGAS